MAAQRKYPEELRDRAVKMVLEIRERGRERAWGDRPVGRQLDVHPEALRSWLQQVEIDSGQRPGTTTGDDQRIAELERENRELRQGESVQFEIAGHDASDAPGRQPSPSASFERPVTRHASSSPSDLENP